MASHEEEIRARFSVDTSPLAKANRELADFANKGHSGFVHVEKGARGLHKAMHEIIATSGPLGQVLNIAVNRTAGAFIALAAGVGWVFEKLKEFNSEMDKIGEANAKPIWSREQMDKAREGVEKLESAHKKFQEGRAPKEDDALKRIEDELDNQKKLKLAYEEIARINKDRSKAELEMEKALTDQKQQTLDVSKAEANLALAKKNLEEINKTKPIIQTVLENQVGESQVGIPFYVPPSPSTPPVVSNPAAEAAARQKIIDDEARARRDLEAHRALLAQAAARYSAAQGGVSSADTRSGKVAGIIQKLYGQGVNPVGLPKPTIDPMTGGIAYRGLSRSAADDEFADWGWDPNAARSIAYKGIPGALGVPYNESVSTAKSGSPSGVELVQQIIAIMQAGVPVTGKE